MNFLFKKCMSMFMVFSFLVLFSGNTAFASGLLPITWGEARTETVDTPTGQDKIVKLNGNIGGLDVVFEYCNQDDTSIVIEKTTNMPLLITKSQDGKNLALFIQKPVHDSYTRTYIGDVDIDALLSIPCSVGMDAYANTNFDRFLPVKQGKATYQHDFNGAPAWFADVVIGNHELLWTFFPKDKEPNYRLTERARGMVIYGSDFRGNADLFRLSEDGTRRFLGKVPFTELMNSLTKPMENYSSNY